MAEVLRNSEETYVAGTEYVRTAEDNEGRMGTKQSVRGHVTGLGLLL